MAKAITIRNEPDDTCKELAARAARSGRSLQAYLRARLVEFASVPDVDTLMARVRARKQTAGSTLSVAQILEHRDAEGR